MQGGDGAPHWQCCGQSHRLTAHRQAYQQALNNHCRRSGELSSQHTQLQKVPSDNRQDTAHTNEPEHKPINKPHLSPQPH